jgi:arylsulfatase A-like enzyme
MKRTWNRRGFLRATCAGAMCGALPGVVTGLGVRGPRKRSPNILFISVDDLRPDLGAYGNREIHSPHFDQLANEGMVFHQAYCQAAACAPSRASLMTGLRPDSTRVWSLGEEFRETVPNVVTMPQYLSRFGYYTVSLGKIFHNHMPDSVSWHEPDLRPRAFNTPELVDRDPESFYYDEGNIRELELVRQRRLERNPNAYAGGWAYGRCTEISDGPDDDFYDGAQTELALETLRRIADPDRPFFMALGYYRPHLPFAAPRRYWDLYDREKLSLAPNSFLPKDAPVMAADSNYELTGCYDMEFVDHPARFDMPEPLARKLKHGYYASVSYVDACLGRLLKGLRSLGLEDDTVVVVWGDHGYKLGEHNGWTKQTNYTIDTRVPLIIRAPGMPMASHATDRLVELVDLFPSVCELAGVDVPGNMEGMSLVPLLRNPEHPWKDTAFSQYHRRPGITPDGGRYMGYSMVTPRYHYVEWRHWDNDAKKAGEIAAVELYDLRIDPQENVNLAARPGMEALVARMGAKLQEEWTGGTLS